MGLEELIQDRQKQLKEAERKIASAVQEREGLKAVITNLKLEKASLEASVKAASEEVSRGIEQFVPDGQRCHPTLGSRIATRP